MRYLMSFLCFWGFVAGTQAQKTDADLASQWKSVGSSFQQKQRFDSSTYYFRLAAPLFKKTAQWDEYYWLQCDIAYNYLDQGDPDQGLQHIQTAIDELTGQTQEEPTAVLGDLYRCKGVIYYESGHYQEAKPAYELSLELYRKTLGDQDIKVGYILNNLANVYYRDFQIKKAIDLYEKALEIKRKNLPPDHKSIITSLTGLANTYDLFGDFPRALSYHRQCYEAAKSKDNKGAMALSLGNMALVSNHMGDYQTGLEYAAQSRLLAEEVHGPQSKDAAFSWQVSGNAFYQMNDFKAALGCYQAILDMHDPRKKGFNQEYANALINVGMTWRELKDLDKAIAAFDRALTYFKTVYPDENHVKVAEIYNNIGECFYDEGKTDEAKARYRHALSINRQLKLKDNVEVIRSSLRLAVAEPDPDSALFFAQQVLRLTVPGFEPARIEDNPRIEHVRWPDLLLDGLCQKALSARKKYRITGEIGWLTLAELTIRLSEDLAREQLMKAAADDSKIAFFAHSAALYTEGLRVSRLLEEKDPAPEHLENAWHIIEQARSTVLLGKMNARELMQLGGVPESERDRYWSAGMKLAHLEQDLRDGSLPDTALIRLKEEQFVLQQENNKMLDSLKTNYPAYYALQHPGGPPPMQASLTRMLAPGEILVEYLLRDTSLFIFTGDRDHQRLYEVPFPEQLMADIADFRKGLTDIAGFINRPQETLAAFVRPAYRLYNALIGPVKTETEGRDLLIIPDGPLHYIPFEALVSDTALLSGKSDFAALPYLIRDHGIRYAASASVLLQQLDQSRRRKGRGMLAVAPMYQPLAALDGIPATRTYNRLSPLPGAADEARRVEAYFPGEVLAGMDATEGAFKSLASRYAILHLATHAVVDESDPLRSFLALAVADDGPNEGFVYAWELANLDLSARLAVLSACNTGAGKLTASEGLLSLGRAFTMAGVPSVVMSLWPVEDATTADLMAEFYRGLAGDMPKDKALRQAKLQYLSAADPLFAHPYYWAGFVLQGDPRPLNTGDPLAGWWWIALLAFGLAGALYLFRKRFIRRH